MNAIITHSTTKIPAFPRWQGVSIPEYPIDILFKYLSPKIWYLDPQKVKDSVRLNQRLNSGNPRTIHAVCVNYIYRKLSFFDVIRLLHLSVFIDSIYAFVFLA